MIILTVTRDDKLPDWFVEQVSPYNFMHQTCRHDPFRIRNAMLKQAILDGHDKALFVDDDTKFRPEHVDMLLARNLEIVGGSYLTRRAENAICAVRNNAWVSPDVRGLLHVNMVGCGFMMLDLEFIKNLPTPWFRYEFYQNEHGERDQTSADFGLCLHAESCGYKIYCDCDCIVEHCL